MRLKRLRKWICRPKLNVENQLERLDTSTRLLADRFFELQFRQKILEPMVFSKKVSGTFDNSYGAHAFNFLRQSLLFDQIRGLWALIWDRDTRTYSASNIMRTIQIPEIKDALRTRFAEPPPPKHSGADASGHRISDELLAKFRNREREEAEARFDENFDKLNIAWKKLNEAGLTKKFGKARNRAIVHFELLPNNGTLSNFDISTLGLKWGDSGNCIELVAPVIYGINLICRAHSYDEEGFSRMHQEYSDDFWRKLISDGK